MLIESFTDFVELHNRLSTEFKSSENITKTQIHCLEMFGKFVSEYEFKIKASSEEVLDEIRRLNDSYASCHIKLWNSKIKIAEGIRDWQGVSNVESVVNIVKFVLEISRGSNQQDNTAIDTIQKAVENVDKSQ